MVHRSRIHTVSSNNQRQLDLRPSTWAILTTKLLAPAHRIAEYRIMNLDMTATKPNAYWGQPRPELDEAWEELTGCTFILRFGHLFPTDQYLASTIYVSKEDMKMMNKTSIALKDDKGYAGYYAVYHQLHCLVRSPLPPLFCRQWRDYYALPDPVETDSQAETHVPDELSRVLLTIPGQPGALS